MQRTTGAVILAAGMSSRMNAFKPMLPIGPVSAIQKVIMTLFRAGVELVVVVTGYQAELLEAHVAATGAACIRNEAYPSSDMLESIRIGIGYLESRCDQALIAPVDVPLFAERTAQKLYARESTVVVPRYQGRAGHPLLVRKDLFSDLIAYAGADGLKGVIQSSGCSMEMVDVDDEGILLGMNTPEEYQRVLEAYEKERRGNVSE
ncbi:MAG: nucleotidyltransferase family protein [Clostridiales bacterium]|nr:nucleotidyltransferase family protein [Clostridiales bacterium]